MKDVLLALPTLADGEAAAEYIRAHSENGEHHIHGCSGLYKLPFEEWVRISHLNQYADTCQSGFRPATQFVLKRTTDGKWLGLIHIRHELNDYLYWFGGHIGYSVHPNERRKGYASFMLQQALAHCRELDIARVLVTCNAKNVASERTILAGGGVLENSCMEETGLILRRYWIDNA